MPALDLNRKVLDMADEKEKILKDDDILQKMEIWFKNNRKMVMIIGGAVVVLVGGFLGYKYLYVEKRENNAAEELYEKSFFHFAQDSFKLAVNGDPATGSKGLVQIVKKWDDTDAGEIGRYALGMSYLHLGKEDPAQFQQAVNMLKEVDYGEEEVMLTTQAIGAMGDAYVEQGQLQQALQQYQKAAKRNDNLLLTPYYLMKSAMVYEEMGDWQNALATYKKIQSDYPDSDQADNIERYIGRAEYNAR